MRERFNAHARFGCAISLERSTGFCPLFKKIKKFEKKEHNTEGAVGPPPCACSRSLSCVLAPRACFARTPRHGR